MKVYKYFIDLSEINVEDYPGINPISNIEVNGNTYNLYAFTNNKEYAKEFEADRDMKLFMKTVTDMKKDDYEDYCNLYSHSTLSKYSFISDVSIYGPKKVSIIATMAESDEVGELYTLVMDNVAELLEDIMDNVANDLLGNATDISDFTHIFTEDVRDALDVLGFSNLISDYAILMELPFPIYDLAEFDYFIERFHNTFNCDTIFN